MRGRAFSHPPNTAFHLRLKLSAKSQANSRLCHFGLINPNLNLAMPGMPHPINWRTFSGITTFGLSVISPRDVSGAFPVAVPGSVGVAKKA